MSFGVYFCVFCIVLMLCVNDWQVRELGKIMGVPEGFLKRHPFPGPGLAVRVPGDVTLGNHLDTLRKV